MSQTFKFRGCDNLHYAKLLTDDADGVTYDTPKPLAPLAEVGKTTGSDSASHYADNKSLLIINSEADDELSLEVFGISLEVLADILGKTFDTAKGAYIDSARSHDYFALMYREKLSNGKYRYVSRLKVMFSIPDEGSATEDDGTDASGQSLSATGVFTSHEFTNGGAAKGVIVDTQYAGANDTDWFASVKTPDNITARPAPQAPSSGE